MKRLKTKLTVKIKEKIVYFFRTNERLVEANDDNQLKEFVKFYYRK